MIINYTNVDKYLRDKKSYNKNEREREREREREMIGKGCWPTKRVVKV